MNDQNHTSAQSAEGAQEWNPTAQAEDAQPDEPNAADHAARSVMHPDAHDTDWRYYFGAWGG